MSSKLYFLRLNDQLRLYGYLCYGLLALGFALRNKSQDTVFQHTVFTELAIERLSNLLHDRTKYQKLMSTHCYASAPLPLGALTMTTAHQQVWEAYVESWKAASRQEKLAIYQECLSRDCVYTDPLTQTQGWDALADYMLDFHQQIPGGHFVTTWFLAHHGRSIAKWEMRGGGGEKLGEGISYATYSDGPTLLSMTGFFETA